MDRLEIGAAMSVAVWAGVVVLGGLGAVLRFVIDREVTQRLPGDFPSGILLVNVSGALLLGLLGGLGPNTTVALLVGVAFLGSYTTFSTWMLQTLLLADERRVSLAAANIGVSLALGVSAAALGWWVGTQF